ncbi:MAG: nucleotide-diphospho-sugar transferase [Muribaculum sp.]|nr:nucleotide-diphospho-sugar transferase [Muribaculum sp.]
MDKERVTTPDVAVLFVIFNRRDVALKSFEAIRAYRPSRLYIAADGPRDGNEADVVKCEETRRAVLDMIDWPCRLSTMMRDSNLGCDRSMYSAISWFFESEEFGVIVEDDIVLSPDFFRLCEVVGPKYADEDRVMAVSAQYLGRKRVLRDSYGFSASANIWGWATWRRAWAKMDMSMSRFPEVGLKRHIAAFGLLKGLMLHRYYWSRDYRMINYHGVVKPWDTIWIFNIFACGGLVIVPAVNLAVNIGCSGSEGTHYSADDTDLYGYMKPQHLQWPLSLPSAIRVSPALSAVERRDFVRVRVHGFMKKIKSLFGFIR